MAQPLLLAAAATALGFFSFLPTDYRGVAQLGIIAGGGMIVAVVLSFTFLPALLRKAHEASLSGAYEFTIWGTGTPRREFLHVDDCADALVFLMQHYSGESPVNVGTGKDISILELAQLVARLDVLAAECVKATYFLVGRMARAYPNMVKRIYADGHTIDPQVSVPMANAAKPAATIAPEPLDDPQVQQSVSQGFFAAPVQEAEAKR